MKICNTCFTEKKLYEFHKNSKTKDLRAYTCKACMNIRSKNTYQNIKNNPLLSENERIRHNEKYLRLYKKSFKPLKEFGIENKRYNYAHNYPEKILIAGKCRNLKKTAGFNNHHWSYNIQHAKDIIVLSIPDHKLIHKYLIYDQEYFMYRKLSGELLDTKELHIEYLKSLGIIL